MNTIKNSFSIYDLENLTGIKAHTIRIWEKRYKLLNPARLTRNVRVYTLQDLQKILNISLLQKYKYKISDLSKLSAIELAEESKSVFLLENPPSYSINSLLVSMFSFDEALFEQVYTAQIKTTTFKEIFIKIYLPLLNYIGVLWQTNAVQPANEHFIANLIYQKITLHTALLDANGLSDDEVYVLFLPEGEIHEIGLLFFKYCLKLKKKKVIYLGRNVPFDNLFPIHTQFKKIIWVSAFLINKPEEIKNKFIFQMEKLIKNTENSCLVIGKVWNDFPKKTSSKNIIFYDDFGKLLLKMEA